MQTKHRKIMFIISVTLIMVLFTSVLAINSYSRYVVEENAKYTDGNNTMDYIDYTVNSVFVVRSQDELFSAINSGYSYVQLDKSIENPLIVTQKAETLDRDLILDLNGIEIQRNGYDPILIVKPGVRLTVVDTSTEQTGGLYNPVGSVFQINGGILTVVAGTFESGPRYSEYYSYNNRVLNNSGDTKRTIIEDTKKVKLYTKSGDGFVSDEAGVEAPIIRSYPQKTGEITYNRGNLYFDEKVSMGAFTIKPDTYCYYRTSEDSAANSTEVSTADWYYTYYVNASDYEYASAEEPDDKTQDYVQITIYGYENVVNKAANKTNANDYHAAIQMTGGTLDVQSGSFNQYFGVNKTACVNAQGGEINIKKGSFSSRVPNALSYNPSTVLIKESDKVSFNESYFDNFTWNTDNADLVYQLTVDGTIYDGRLARSGQAYCILNGGNANVTVGVGTFYSSNNNIISMQGGNLVINSGTLTKHTTKTPDTTSASGVSKENAAIDMGSGSLAISNAKCSIKGDNSIAVKIDAGTLTIDNSGFTIDGNYSYGIYSSITTTPTNSFNVFNTGFTVNGNNSVGIYSQNGQINISSDAKHSIIMTGTESSGIYVENSGSVYSENYTYTLSGESSIGIFAKNGAASIEINKGSMSVSGSNTYGIKSSISGTDSEIYKFTVTDFSISMTDGSNQTAIYSANGAVKLTTSNGSNIEISPNGEGNAKGIHIESGGSVHSEYYSYKINGNKSYGIYAQEGNVNIKNATIWLTGNDNNYGIYATSLNKDKNIQIDISLSLISIGSESTSKKSGETYYASAGVFLSSSDTSSSNTSSSDMTSLIKLTDTSIECDELGVVSNGGKVLLTNSSGSSSHITTTNASAIAIRGGNVEFDANSNYTVTSANTRDDASTNSYNLQLPISGDSTIGYTDYVNTDGIYVNGGSFTSNGTLTLIHTGLQNDTMTSGYNYASLVVKSYALRVYGGNVEIKGTTTITAKIGGGVYAGTTNISGNVESGTVTLGTQNNQNDITIHTTGIESDNTPYNAIGTYISVSWQSYQSKTGGHAIEVEGGSITIYNGTYTAEFGDGVKATGSGNINIYGGIFNGFMHDTYSANAEGKYVYSTKKLTDKSGPSAFYGLKVIGGATVNIHGGTFDGGNGGAFVTGVTAVGSDYSLTHGKNAKVYIYKGVFGGENAGLDAFNVYDYADVVFGAAEDSSYFGTAASADVYKNAIVLNTSKTTIAANSIVNTKYNGSNAGTSSILVYYGTYPKQMYHDKYLNCTFETYNTDTSIGYTSVNSAQGVKNNTTVEYYIKPNAGS